MDRHDNLEAKLRELGREARTTLPTLDPPQGARRRIKTKRALTAGLSGALVIALAAGAMAGMKFLPGRSSGSLVDLSDAVAATEQTSAKVRAEGRYTFEGGPFTEKANEGTMTMQGMIDFATGDGILTMTTDTFLQEGDLTTLTVDGKTYMKTEPPLDPERPWLVSEARADESSVFGMQPQTDANSYLSEILNLVDIEELGREEIYGVETTHYRGRVDEDLFSDEPGQTGEMGPWDIWIGDDLLVRRMAMSVAFSSEEMGNIEMSFDMTYYDFGVKVDLEAPPADQIRDADDPLPTSPPEGIDATDPLFMHVDGHFFGVIAASRGGMFDLTCATYPKWATTLDLHLADRPQDVVMSLVRDDAMHLDTDQPSGVPGGPTVCFQGIEPELDLVIEEPTKYGFTFSDLLGSRKETGTFEGVASSYMEPPEDEVDPDLGPIAQVILDAAAAEESYRTSHPGYTKSIEALEAEGFNMVDGIRVQVVSATSDGYCIEGWNEHGRLHVDSTSGFPEEGSCADAG